MKVAITGGRGRLAPVIARTLRDSAELKVYSRTAGGGFLSYEDFEEPEILIHCAWSSVPLTAEEDPGLAEREDLPLMERLIQRAPRALFVFLSTAAVYGNTDGEPADENAPLSPRGAYARGKIAAEELILEKTGGHCLILRTTNLLGESADPAKPQGVLPRLVAAARSGTEFPLWGDGSAVKDYLHVDDFVRALQSLVEKGCRGVFNVGSGHSIALRELIAHVEAAAGRPIRVKRLPHYSWDVERSLIRVDKLRQTDWAPLVSLGEAVQRSFKA